MSSSCNKVSYKLVKRLLFYLVNSTQTTTHHRLISWTLSLEFINRFSESGFLVKCS